MHCIEIPWVAAEDAFLALVDDPYLVFFDSAAKDDARSKTSYLCTTPVTVRRFEHGAGDPFTQLAQWRVENSPAGYIPPDNWPFPFVGGVTGWLGYDLGRAAAGVRSRFAPVPDLPGGWVGLYDTIVGFDHGTRRAWILAAAETRLVPLAARLAAPPDSVEARAGCPIWEAETPRAVYDERLARLHAYIGAGDVYQANFTARFIAARDASFSPAAYYLGLRVKSPAPFAAYLACGDGVTIAGASPERFLRLHADGRVETRPIKGTAPRHENDAADRCSAEALRASPKECAENLMIVDLLRNDLGQVCETGSIAVPELFAVESYAQAHHLVSAVTGRLRTGLGAEDLLRATFPGGSITGAPKRRAMEIIDELETGPRGAYCGMTAWIGFDGAMDSSIIIRTLVATPGRLFAQAGGGITWDSETGAEYDEMMLKLSPLLACHG
jgi:para-aminobenzoate synthetase component I